HGRDLFESLDLHDDAVMDEQIEAVARLDLDSVIYDRQRKLPLEGQTRLAQFVSETGLVDALEQAWPQRSMNRQGAAQDPLADLVLVHLCALCAFSAPSVMGSQRSTLDRSSPPAGSCFCSWSALGRQHHGDPKGSVGPISGGEVVREDAVMTQNGLTWSIVPGGGHRLGMRGVSFALSRKLYAASFDVTPGAGTPLAGSNAAPSRNIRSITTDILRASATLAFLGPILRARPSPQVFSAEGLRLRVSITCAAS